jgi:hypothetical protein
MALSILAKKQSFSIDRIAKRAYFECSGGHVPFHRLGNSTLVDSALASRLKLTLVKLTLAKKWGGVLPHLLSESRLFAANLSLQEQLRGVEKIELSPIDKVHRERVVVYALRMFVKDSLKMRS